MKKIFTSSLTYLILIVILNCAVLISLCVVTNKKYTYPNNFIGGGKPTENQTILSKYYEVRKGNIDEKERFESEIVTYSSLYSTYELDECNIEELNEVKKDEVLGKKDGVEVKSSYDGFCVKVEKNEKTIISIYNYNQFKLIVSISSIDYMDEVFKKDDTLTVDFSGKEYEVTFEKYDVSSYKDQGKIYASFVPTKCNLLVNENSPSSILKLTKSYTNVFFIDAAAFEYSLTTVYFIIYQNEEAQYFPVNSTSIIGNKAIIEASNLSEGMKLYVR